MNKFVGGLILFGLFALVFAQDNATVTGAVETTGGPASGEVSAGVAAAGAGAAEITTALPGVSVAAGGEAKDLPDGGAAPAIAGADSNGTAAGETPVIATDPGAALVGSISGGGENGTAAASVPGEPAEPAEPGAGGAAGAAGAPVTPAAVTAPFVAFKFSCDTEVDDNGPKCADWGKSGFCEKHKATKFLFCRKTCLCTGPGK